jgi:hypothetical protein
MRFLRSIPLLLIAALSLTAGCASTPKVGTDYDPSYSFGEVQKVAVMRPNAALARAGGRSPVGVNDLIAARITRHLEDAMKARGYQVVDPSDADLIATFFVSTQDKTDMQTYNVGMSYGRCWNRAYCANWGTPDVRVDQYQEGTLFIDMVDPQSGDLKWRGVTSQRLPKNPPSEAEREKISREVVVRILDQFPPTSSM